MTKSRERWDPLLWAGAVAFVALTGCTVPTYPAAEVESVESVVEHDTGAESWAAQSNATTGCWAMFTTDDMPHLRQPEPLPAYAKNRDVVVTKTRRWFRQVYETDQSMVVRVLRWRKAWVNDSGAVQKVDDRNGNLVDPTGNENEGWFQLPKKRVTFTIDPMQRVTRVLVTVPLQWANNSHGKAAMQVSVRPYDVKVNGSASVSQFQRVAKVETDPQGKGSRKSKRVRRYAHVKELAHTSRVIKTSQTMGFSSSYLQCGEVDPD